MELYEEVTKKILSPLIWLQDEYFAKYKKEIKKRAKSIEPILIGISSIKIEETVTIYGEYIHRAKYRNIKNNRDLTRQEFRGAIQKYLLGFNLDSLKQSFDSIESALLTIHDERIKNNQLDLKHIRHPFTFGKSKDLAISKKYGFVKDKEIKNILTKIVKMRNGFIHQYNFLSTLIRIYKDELPNLKMSSQIFDKILPLMDKMNIEDINLFLEMYGFNLQQDTLDKAEVLIENNFYSQLNQDIKNSIETITRLSDFEWCTKKSNLEFMDSMILDFLNSEENMEFGFDLIGYLSYHTLNEGFTVLKYLKFF